MKKYIYIYENVGENLRKESWICFFEKLINRLKFVVQFFFKNSKLRLETLSKKKNRTTLV